MKSVEIYTGAWHGDSSSYLTFPESWDVQVIGDNPGPALEVDAMKQRMLQPIGTERLASLARALRISPVARTRVEFGNAPMHGELEDEDDDLLAAPPVVERDADINPYTN